MIEQAEKKVENLCLMEVVLETKNLASALGFATNIVDKKHVTQVLSGIKITASEAGLEIVATDEDIYLQQMIPAQVLNFGSVVVSASTLSDVIRKTPSEQLKIKLYEDNFLEITNTDSSQHKFQFRILVIDITHFPKMIELSNALSTFSVPAFDFKRLLSYTIFASSNEETRYNLNGVCLHNEENHLYAVATDAHRLSVSKNPAQMSFSGDFNIILPRKSVQELNKILSAASNNKELLECSISDSRAKFVCGRVVMISKLIDGNFPDYKNFIPASHNTVLLISRKLLQNVIDRAATITIEKFRAIKFVFYKTHFIVTASGENKGNAEEVVYYRDNLGEYFCKLVMCEESQDDFLISTNLNISYIMDVLTNVEEEYIELSLDSQSETAAKPSPVKIQPKLDDQHTTDDIFVIMPVRS
jgi:DNA polymerase-3 subunit beta